MRFAFTPEQDSLRETVRDFLATRAPLAATRQRLGDEPGHDAGAWTQLCEQLGLVGMAVPEDLGGQGFTNVELGIAMEETGRVLYSGPFLLTAGFALPLLLAAGAEAALVAPVASGQRIATAALFEDGQQRSEPSVVTAVWQEHDGTVSGYKRFVPHLMAADVALLAARHPGSEGHEGTVLLAVDLQGQGVARHPVGGMDLTRPVADLVLDEAPAIRLGGRSGTWPMIERALTVAAGCLAAELLGGAQACLDATVAYVTQRRQFGVPVGSFQAVQHQCADLLVDIEHARSSTYAALWSLSTSDPEAPVAASMALSQAVDAFEHAARASIQLHGGIGFTWEHDAHLYFRRAASAPSLLGSASFHRLRVADLLGV